ncbi:hypothetical protein LguiA_031486 [Lonicera macranthoides]
MKPERAERGVVWICTQKGVESEFEFWPIEHPTEPLDEDQPVKCPVPGSSVTNNRRTQRGNRSLRAELSTSVKKEERLVAVPEDPPVRAVRKRHHNLTHGDHIMTPLLRMPPHYPYPPQSITIFDVLQQLNKFES